MSNNIRRFICQMVIRQQPAVTSVRLYGRWVHRKPAKVLLSYESTSKGSLKKEKIIDLVPGILQKSERNEHMVENNMKPDSEDVTSSRFPADKSKVIKNKREEKLKRRNFDLRQQKVFGEDNEIIYEKLKENDGRISTMLIKLKSKKERMRTGQTLVEGWRLIVDGLEAKCNLKYVIFSRMEDLNNLRPFLPKSGVKFYKISYKEIALWSDVETPSGILGVFETPKPENIKRLSRPLPLQFLCDNIRVPGNLGAILRAAVGVGCEKVILTKGCVDVWEPKVIRSASGAHFRLPIYQSVGWDEMHQLLEPHTSIFIADSNAKIEDDAENNVDKFEIEDLPVLPYYGVEYSSLQHVTLIIGGETEGISEDSYRLASNKNGLRLNIPLERGVDSLNTGMATAVIAFEIKKQLVQAWAKIKLKRQMEHST